MKHNIKRILNLLLVMALMMSVTPATALSADNTDYVVTWEGDDLPNDNFNENSQYSAKGITVTCGGSGDVLWRVHSSS